MPAQAMGAARVIHKSDHVTPPKKQKKTNPPQLFSLPGPKKLRGKKKKSTFSLVVTASKPRPLEVELLSRRLRGRSVISGDSSKWVAATSRQQQQQQQPSPVLLLRLPGRQLIPRLFAYLS